MRMDTASVRAFRGIRYDAGRVPNLDAVVAPPYDVISPEQKEAFLARHPNNVVRLILPDATPGRDKYSEAGHLLQKWISEGVLVQDPAPMMYVCEQAYDVGGETVRRIGLTCLVRLEDYGTGAILPHERVLARPREDRLNLIRATRANLDSVFGLHDAKGVQKLLLKIIEGTPVAEATDSAGVRCRMWAVSDPTITEELSTRLQYQPILIADGHHRYDSALTYRNEMRAATGTDPNAPHEFVMMTIVSFEDEGLTILPTHRLLRELEGIDMDSLVDRLREGFDVTEFDPHRLAGAVASEHDTGTAFGLYLGGGKGYLLRPRADVDPTAQDIPGSDALKRLDVTVLHSMILDRMLAIDTRTPEGQASVAYTRDDSEAIDRVDSGEFRLSFLMNAMRVEEVREVAAAGDIMPQKSTFFYPKLLTGMVMRAMEGR